MSSTEIHNDIKDVQNIGLTNTSNGELGYLATDKIRANVEDGFKLGVKHIEENDQKV